MRSQTWHHGMMLQGKQIAAVLLVILLSHLLLMMTPLHDAVLLGHPTPHEMMDVRSVHAASADCVGPAAIGDTIGVDCAIRGSAPSRSGAALLLGTTPPGRAEPTVLVGLLPAPVGRSVWPPPLADPQALFQVFRL